MAKGTSTLNIEVDQKSLRQLTGALKALGESNAPYLREALDDAGQRFTSEVRRRARGGIAAKVRGKGVTGKGTALRFRGVVAHPGARSEEFGRVWYWRGYRGRAMSATGRRFRVGAGKGQKARPYLGVMKGDAAIGATVLFARQRILRGVDDEWSRIGGD